MRFLATDRALSRQSYYAATATRTRTHAPLAGPARCDVAVVGGGFAGLSAALDLAAQGRRVIVLEAREVGSGASGRNGGQVIHGLACDQSTIESQLGLADARRVWDMTIEAMDLLRQRIAAHGIDCDWQDGYLGVATKPRKGRELAAWADRMESVYHYPVQRVSPADIGRHIASPRYHSGIFDPRSGHLHPLKYALGLAEACVRAGVTIHEQTEVTGVAPGAAGQPVRVQTAQGEVLADQVLLAGNVYLQGVSPRLARRIMPVGTYIVCSEPMDPALAESLVPGRPAVCDTDFVLDYFRTTRDHRMLYGGRASYSAVTPAKLVPTMQARMRETFPQLAGTKVEFAWGGFVDITMNRAPDFGRLAPNLYYLQGFSGHGVALTGLAGRLVAEAMNGDAGRFDLFARLQHRNFPGGDLLRTPALVLGMAWYRLLDLL